MAMAYEVRDHFNAKAQRRKDKPLRLRALALNFLAGAISMESEVPIRLVLVDPPGGVDFGIQRGRGAQYEALFVQQRTQGDISFDFSLTVSESRKDGMPNFQGPFAQGPPVDRFVYIDVELMPGRRTLIGHAG
jgi:hypothetical protein